MRQITNNIMMIEPVSFNYNAETAFNNHYQINNTALSKEKIQEKALAEFKGFVSLLRSKNINVILFKDTENPSTPDSIFPNNWISFHNDGEIVLYPMYAKNRRLERRKDIIQKLRHDFKVTSINDLSNYECQEVYLEGTGSMILDRENKICYAAISDRTNKNVVNDFCNQFNFKPILFTAKQDVDNKRLPIYHTNVMMCVASNFAIVCIDSIDNNDEKSRVINTLNNTNKEIISISEDQTNKFAGNMLEVEGDKKYLVMSYSAYSCLSKIQIKKIEEYCEILYSDLSTIENYGGGSARCMMAEIFLPLKND
tara:strand:- start:510 stop:1442 length:933 start_codon:yes stop_codon:yes gene_type:complete